METGRVPPQAIEIEQKVLGAMLQSQNVVGVVMEIINVGDFYRQIHNEIFSAMIGLFERNEPIDNITVANELKKSKQLEAVGGDPYLMELVESAMTPANAEYHANIIKEKSTLRGLINTSTNIITRCFEDVENVDDLLDDAERKIFDISQDRVHAGFTKLSELLPRTFEDIERYGKEGNIQGIPSGFKDLDEKTSGFQPGDLIILAGRPSMGKTALALCMTANAAIHAGKSIALFSLEMAHNQLVLRMLCAQAKVNMHLVRTGRLPHGELPKLALAAGPLNEARIFIDDSSDVSVLEIRAKARRLKAQGNLDLLIVDYLQLMQSPRGMKSRENEIAYISRSLKNLSKDLNIPILALSQLSRRTEQRPEGKPQLSDLRESGAIEQDADVVLFIYREHVYNESADPGKAEIIIGKQRNGPVGTVDMTFVRDFAGFENYSPRAEEITF
jgi:replicative DNA helicase